MSIVKKYFSWVWILILILPTSSCEEVEVCDGIKNIKIPTLEIAFRQTENSNIDLSNLLFFKEGKPISLEIKDSKIVFDLNFPKTQNLIDIRYKKTITDPKGGTKEEIESLAQIEIETKPYYVSLACGFALEIKEEEPKIIFKSPEIKIKETIEEIKGDEKKGVAKKTKKTDKKNAEKIKLKLALDIIFLSS